jgi:hypothetical protein
VVTCFVSPWPPVSPASGWTFRSGEGATGGVSWGAAAPGECSFSFSQELLQNHPVSGTASLGTAHPVFCW